MKIEPGMLCLVIGGRNAGRECTVIRRIGPGHYLNEIGAIATTHCWFVKGPSIEALSEEGYIFVSGYGAETSLMPLANGQDDAIVKSEVIDYVAG